MKDPGNQPSPTRALTAPPGHADMHSRAGMTPAPSHAQIARRAYDIYLSKGRLQGQCQMNWLQAELELRQQHEMSDAAGLTEAPSDSHADSEPEVETFVDALPSFISGRRARQGRTTSAP